MSGLSDSTGAASAGARPGAGGSREQTLASLLGNQRQKQTLIELTNDGRLCHALLITGPVGSGRRSMARLAAAAMLCESERRPCGVCPSCRKVLEGVHPDVITLDCSDTEHELHRIAALHERVLDTVSVAPNEASRKVYILANFDDISFGTPNALLKTLEEPPAHVCFVLTAVSRERLLETILSRVQTIELEPLPRETVAAELSRRFPDADPAQMREAVGFSFGCIGEGEAILTDPARQELNSRVRRAAAAIADGDEYSLLASLTLPDRKKGSMKTLLRTLQLTLLEGLDAAVTGSGHGIGAELAGGISVRLLTNAIERVDRAGDDIDRNVSLNILPASLSSGILGR